MATSQLGTRRRLGLVRSDQDRLLAGVAGGLGRAYGIDPALIRISFAILALAGGAGVLAYLLLALVMERPSRAIVERRLRSDLRTVAGLACISLGSLIVLRRFGFWIGDMFVWPASMTALGGAVVWARRGDGGGGSEILSPWRLVVGTLLAMAGVVSFLAANVDLYAVPSLIVPIVVVLGGLVVVFGPYLVRTWNQLAEERRERIRSEERSTMAAHLHDSVLQTLALIQRSDSGSRMASLARVQERELRSWLYGRTDSPAGEHLSTAIDAAAGRAEELHEVNVEVVVVGDAPLDENLSALVAACGEAINNASRHSGSKDVAVYIEVEPEQVTAFVRDQGKGFEPGTVPHDRRGIADSIVGRINRHGGAAKITSSPGEGTEVMLTMPRASNQ